MWLRQGLLSSNSFIGLNVRRYFLKHFAEKLNIANRGIYCKQSTFRTIILPNVYNIEFSSRRFFCSGIENDGRDTASTEDDDSPSSEKLDEFELDDIDDLAQYLGDFKSDQPIIKEVKCNEEQMKYLANLANGNEKTLDKLTKIYFIVQKAAETLGLDVDMDSFDWLRMLESNPNSMRRFLKYQLMKVCYKKKKVVKTKVYPREELLGVTNFDISCYHTFHNSLFLRFRRSANIYRFLSRGVASILYSPPLIFDCSYEQYMSKEEIQFVARQLSNVIIANNKSVFPLHIILCNFNESLYLAKIIHVYIQNFFKEGMPITVTEKSYLDLFPKEELCYLTPNGSERVQWNPEKKYIVGAFVDKKCTNMKISLAKANLDGMNHMRLPLEHFVKWEKGSKSLSLPVVCGIMSSMYYYRDWNKAFEVLPRRFLQPSNSAGKRRKPFLRGIVDTSYTNVMHKSP